MEFKRVAKSIVSVSVCAVALIVVAGCSSASAPSSSSASAASGGATSSSVQSSASASSANASSASASSTSTSSSSSAAGGFTKETAIAQGYQVLEGTVHVLDGKGLIDLQGVDIDPAAAGGNGTYAVLAFDQATDVTGMQADGSGEATRSAKMLGIAEHTDYGSFVQEYGDLDLCKSLNGQHVAFAVKAKDITFPSDVRLPIAEPSAKAVVLLP